MKKTEDKTTGKFNYAFITLILVATTLAFCIYNFMALKRSKIACIDSARVVKAYHGIDELTKKMEEKNKAFRAQLDTLSMEFQTAIKEYEKIRSKLSESEAKIEEAKIRRKQEAYAQFNSTNDEKLKTEEREMLEKVLVRVNAKIEKFAKKQGYAAVFGATSAGAVVYMNDYVDITEDIIEIINN